MHLREFAPIGGRATGRRDWRRYERLAEVCENLPNASCFGDEGDQPDVAATRWALEQKLLPHPRYGVKKVKKVSGTFSEKGKKGVRNLFCNAPWPAQPAKAVSPAATGKRFLTPF